MGYTCSQRMFELACAYAKFRQIMHKSHTKRMYDEASAQNKDIKVHYCIKIRADMFQSEQTHIHVLLIWHSFRLLCARNFVGLREFFGIKKNQ